MVDELGRITQCNRLEKKIGRERYLNRSTTEQYPLRGGVLADVDKNERNRKAIYSTFYVKTKVEDGKIGDGGKLSHYVRTRVRKR